MSRNPNSHLTAKERDKASFPTKWLFDNRFLKGRLLDFGSGFGKDTEFLKHNGLIVSAYDPFYSPEYPIDKFDTIICQYVLNVLLPEEQSQVLMSVSELLKPNGRAYFSVRRDLKRTGFRKHFVHKVDTYQSNVVLPYKSIFKNNYCEIYEYQHYNQINNGLDGVFENPGPDSELITELATVYSIFDKYPVSKGHALVIPKRKSLSYFDCTDKEKKAIWIMVDRVKKILDDRFKPDGYNIGFNTNEAAGQTVFHTHVHIVPRYNGDVDNPRGGIRNIIPGKGDWGK